MKTAIYPGSFNPWHEGHLDVLSKTLQVFDRIVIAQGINPEKKTNGVPDNCSWGKDAELVWNGAVVFRPFSGLLRNALVDLAKEGIEVNAIVRGLRNGGDFEYEKAQQYWNEDLGILMPVVFFVSDRKLTHISSSAIRAVKSFKEKK